MNGRSMMINSNKISNPHLLTVAVIPIKNRMDIIASADNQVSVSGIEGFFMDTVLKALGFKYKIVIPSDREWGRLKDGNWTGMIGEVASNRADLACTSISVIEERQKIVDFSSSYTVEVETFAVVKPNPVPTANAIFYPFDMVTWSYIFMVLITFPVLFLVMKTRQSYFEIFFTLLGSVLKQPVTVNIRSLKVTILLVSWLIFTTLTSSIYSSVLLTFLAKPLEQKVVKTFKELSEAVQKGTTECYANPGTYITHYLHQSAVGHMRILGQLIAKNKWYRIYGDPEPIQTTKNIAIISDDFFLQSRDRIQDTGVLVISHESLFVTNIAVAMRKDFCCKDRLNKMITRGIEAGLYDFSTRKFSFDSSTPEILNEKVKRLTVSDTIGAFYVFISGITLSFITLTIEIIFDKYNRTL